MDRAINKSTGQLISAFEVYNNGSYQNLTKGEWTAPKDSIYNPEECSIEDLSVHYTKEKEYTNFRGKRIWCCPHFALYPGSKAQATKKDPLHEKLKDWLFGRLKEDDIEIVYSKGTKPHKYENKYKLSQLAIDWNNYDVEVHSKSSTKKIIADILLPFIVKHPLLGEGIVFEIQISPQSDRQTNDRSILRAIQGYSVCWLFEEDFITDEKELELKNPVLSINSFSEQMHYAKKNFVAKLKHTVEEQCRFLDEKIKETNVEVNKIISKGQEVLNEIELQKEEVFKKIDTHTGFKVANLMEKIRNKEEAIIDSIKKIEENPFNAVVDSYKIEIENGFQDKKRGLEKEYQNLISTMVSQNNILKSNFQYWQEQMKNPEVIGECRVCGTGVMMLKEGKWGKFYGCSNYPQCTNTLKFKRLKYGETNQN